VIGSKAGYAQLWYISFNFTAFDDPEVVRLDDDILLNHPGGEQGDDVVVTLAGSGTTLFLGYPSYDDERGMVRAYDINNNLDIVEKYDCIHERYASFQGKDKGDRFGADISTDVFGNFVVIGTNGGGYVRAASFKADVNNIDGGFRRVGSDIRTHSEMASAGFGTSVATGRVPYKGCPQCGFELHGRRIVVGSTLGFYVYQFEGEQDWLWYQIAEHESQSGVMPVKVSMSVNSQYLVIGTPDAESGRGRVDAYTILDHNGEQSERNSNGKKNSTLI
jgi:hypothetical protein